MRTFLGARHKAQGTGDGKRGREDAGTRGRGDADRGTQHSALSTQHSLLITHHSSGGTGRGRRLALLAGLTAALVVVGVLGMRYVVAPQPGQAAQLPNLATLPQAVPPRFLFSINGVSHPLGVAVSPNGDRVYVTESEGERETKVFDADGNPLGSLNPPDSAPDSRIPVYVAAGPDGRVYVSDRRAGTMHVYSPEGSYLGKLPVPEGAGNSWAPLGLAFDGQGNLLVTNVGPGKHGVAVLTPDGAVLRQFGKEGSAPGEYSYPNAAATDRAGRLLVSDSNNGRVVLLDPEGNPLWSFGRGGTDSAIGLPRGLVVDDRNRVYVADTVSHNILVFDLGDKEAKLLFALGQQGIKDGELNFPNGLALERGGRLYVTDRENNRVEVWTY